MDRAKALSDEGLRRSRSFTAKLSLNSLIAGEWVWRWLGNFVQRAFVNMQEGRL